MKNQTIMASKRGDFRHFTVTYSGEVYKSEICGVSFGHEPIGLASPDDIEQHRRYGSGLSWIESAASVLLHCGTIKRF